MDLVKKTFRTFAVLIIIGLSLYDQTAVAQDEAYRLGAGDEIRVTIFGQEALSGSYIVEPAGSVSLPLIGQVLAKGQTIHDLKTLVVKALKPDYLINPSVTVEVLNYRPFYILGEVKSPGSYPFVSGMKVINAVALSGGYTYRAKQNSVFIDRPGQESEPISATPNTPVSPGDIIRVPESYF